jgi:hypothetical protein
MAAVKFPVGEQIERGQGHFGLIINQTPFPAGPGKHAERQTYPIGLKEDWGPYTHLVLRGLIDNRRDVRHINGISVVRPSVELSLRMGEGWESGLAARVSYQELTLEEDEIEDGHIDLETATALRPVGFGLETMVDSGGIHGPEYMAHGTIGDASELQPAGRTVAQVLRVGLDTLLDLGASQWAMQLEPERPV